MTKPSDLRVRRSLTELQDAYEKGDKKPLEDLMRAWKGIKELPPEDPNSFFVIGGYHGEPFRGAGWGSGSMDFWGGYCHHGNVLFPIWHRFYVLRIEDALRSIPGCEHVTLPFWDECAVDSLLNGIPWALTVETFELDGQKIDNPLRSYKFPQSIIDHISNDVPNYSKKKGYETVRYPYSGLVGTPEDAAKTKEHNAQWTYEESVPLLNQNIVDWLGNNIVVKGQPMKTGVHQKFIDCLNTPDYTLFSNTTSMNEWNANHAEVVALEKPHNSIHLAIGGFDYPTGPSAGDRSPIEDANGDMGENDTAALDPIFFFHHCFIDRMFWLWQQRHGKTEDLPVWERYPGTNSVDGQGATPGVPPNSWLSMDTPLEPFTTKKGGKTRHYIGRDGFHIEKQLGYKYGPGSLEKEAKAPPVKLAASAEPTEPKVHVTGVDRGGIRGSFVIDAFAEVDGERTHLGSEAVLSRWHVEGCANCQTHLKAGATFPLHGIEAGEDTVHVQVRTRDGVIGGPKRGGLRALASGDEKPNFRVEVR